MFYEPKKIYIFPLCGNWRSSTEYGWNHMSYKIYTFNLFMGWWEWDKWIAYGKCYLQTVRKTFNMRKENNRRLVSLADASMYSYINMNLSKVPKWLNIWMILCVTWLVEWSTRAQMEFIVFGIHSISFFFFFLEMLSWREKIKCHCDKSHTQNNQQVCRQMCACLPLCAIYCHTDVIMSITCSLIICIFQSQSIAERIVPAH